MFGNKEMKIQVEGMMCEHCAMHVKDALLKLEGVKEVKVDLKEKSATLKYKGELKEADISSKVEEAGYKYKGILD